jgi:hypothetical protein
MSLGFLAQFLTAQTRQALQGPGLLSPPGLSVLYLALFPTNKRKRIRENILLRDWEGSHCCSVCFEELTVISQRVTCQVKDGKKLD